MSPLFVFRLIGAFSLWWLGYAVADDLGGRGETGGILAFVILIVSAIVIGLVKKGSS